MLKFLKSLGSGKKRRFSETDTISDEILTGEADSAEKTPSGQNKRADIEVTLSLHPAFEDRASKMQKDFMNKELAQLPSLKEGDIAINGVYVVPSEDKIEVGFYIRNGLPRPIIFDGVPLAIMNLKNEVLGRQVFSLSEMGEIPPHTARPWEVFFDYNNVFVDKIQPDDWKIAFDLQPKKVDSVKVKLEGLPNGVSTEQKANLEKFLENLPPLKPGELDIAPYVAQLQQDGGLLANVIIRNGGRRPVKIEKFPLNIRDAKQREVAGGLFKMVDLSISAYSACLLTLAFSQEEILVSDPDLSSWTIFQKK